MESSSEGKTKYILNNIRKAREVRNYTQDYLAFKLHISQNAYSKIESGLSKMTLVRLLEIAEILQMDINDIIKSTVDAKL